MGESGKREQKREIEAIVDSSAFYPMIKRLGENSAHLIPSLAILDLTKYEIGNVVWKEHKKGLLKDWEKAIKAFKDIFECIQVYSIDQVEEVEKIAVERDLSFYDASYVYIAEKLNLKLLTEDKDIFSSDESAER